jgi:hypothetical protein
VTKHIDTVLSVKLKLPSLGQKVVLISKHQKLYAKVGSGSNEGKSNDIVVAMQE